MKLKSNISMSDLRYFCKGAYYNDVKSKTKWEPLEDYDDSQINEWCDNLLYSLKELIKA